MNRYLRAVLMALLASWMGCADFSEAEQAFCARNPERCGEALQARVLLPSVSATCVRFEVRDPSSDQVLETRWLTRTGDDLEVVIARASLPETVKLAARPFRDGECLGGQEARTPNGPYETVTATFDKEKVHHVELRLRPGTDADGDGYVALASGGADCNDAQAQVNPGAKEQCSDQGDLNCDGRKGCEAFTCGANACAGPPMNLALTLPSGSVEAGTCTSATVQVKDANGGDTRVTAVTLVSLNADPAGGITFFANASCTTPATNVTLGSGESSATFHFRGEIAGSVTIRATAPGLTQDSKVAQLIPGPGNRLVFTSSARPVTAGACSAVQFESLDVQGHPAPVRATTTVALAASPAAGFRFYSNESCTTEVTSVNLAAGESSGSFHFRGTKSGTVTVVLTAPGFTGSSQNMTINAGAPAAMTFTGTRTVQAGDCSTPVTIELRDSFDNPTTAATDTAISLTASGVALTFSANSGCTPTTTSVSIAQGANSTSFHYRGTVAGAANISGTATDLTATPLSVTVTPGPGTALVITTAAQTLTAGNCSGIVKVQLRDAFNNLARVTADTPLFLFASPSTGFRFFADSSCTGSTVTTATIPAGGGDASFYFRGTSSGTVTMSVTRSGFSAAIQSVIINPGPPTVLAFSPSSETMAAGACTQFTLLVQDTFGNASPVASNQSIAFSASPPTGFIFSANSDCSSPGTLFTVTAGQSSRVLYMRGTAVAEVAVMAARTGFTSGTTTVKVKPGAPNKLAFTTNPQTILVGNCSGVTTVQVQDTFNNPVPVAANTQIDLSSNSSGDMVFYSDAACDTPATFVTVSTGQNSANFYFRDSVAETVMITATSTGLTSATQTATIDPLPPTALVFVTNPQTVAATGCSAVTTVETWAGGTPTTVITPTTVNLSANPPTGFTFYANSSCTAVVSSVTIGVGQGSANFYFRGTTPGTVTITAAATGLDSDTQDETITLQPTKLLFTTPAHTTAAGICSALVTVQTADAGNNPVPVPTNTTVNLTQSGTPSDTQFRFYSDMNCNTPVTSVSIPARQGTANFYYRGEVIRTVTLTAAASGLTSASQNHLIAASGLR